MHTFRFIALLLSSLLLAFCKPADKPSVQQEALPAEAKPIDVEITALNCWVERGTFCVTGICNSRSDQWQRIWLRMQALDSLGQEIFLDGKSEAVFPVFSSAVAPRGRSAFFKAWPIKSFTAMPDTCRVAAAGALMQAPGPILLTEGLSSARVMMPVAPGSEAAGLIEQGAQISGILSNPFTSTAEDPQMELLIFGKDNRLWLSVVLDPKALEFKNALQMEGTGPLAAGAKRRFNVQVSYGNLPTELGKQKIGRVEVLAFENR